MKYDIFLTKREVAEMLHLHVNTVYRLSRDGQIPSTIVCKRGDKRYRYSDVMKYLEKLNAASR